MRNVILALLAVSALAAGASAQQASTYTFERKVAPGDPHEAALDKIKAEHAWTMALQTDGEAQQVEIDKLKAEQAWKVVMDTSPVANAPYSAEAVNESVQLLPDGNRIVHRNSTRVYRDSAGRTRRETLDDNGQVILVAVSDPAAGTASVLDTKSNTVSQSMMKMRTTAGPESGTVVAHSSGPATTTVVVSSKDAPSRELVKERITVAAQGGNGNAFYYFVNGAPAEGETTKEDLGQQTIEGVTAAGTRSTTTIPAGAIGNEQPIKIVSEEWTSPELHVLVLTKHSDPRTGETTYRLTGITRTEPARSLFEMLEKK